MIIVAIINMALAEEPKDWFKLIAYNISLKPFEDKDLQEFIEKTKAYNEDLTPISPRWLTQFRDGKQASSVVFLVTTEAEMNICLVYGLNLFGKKALVVLYQT